VPQGSIVTALYYDADGNSEFENSTNDRVILNEATLRIRSGSCDTQSPILDVTQASFFGGALFSNLEAGLYCVEVIESTIDMSFYDPNWNNQAGECYSGLDFTSGNEEEQGQNGIYFREIPVAKDQRTEDVDYWFGFRCFFSID
jgi:hypothetical protein